MKVLITGSRAPVAVLLARTLHAAGCTVYTGDSLTPTLGRYSRYVTDDLPLPPARQEPERYAEAIARYVSRFGLAWVLPTCEEVFHLAGPLCRPALEAAGRGNGVSTGARLFAPPLDTLARLHSKHEFARLAALHGLSIPETRRLAEPADWGAIDYARDGILKREFSRFGESVVRLTGSWNERQQTALATLERGGLYGWVWQRWINGRSVSSYSVCVDGAIRAHVAYRTPYRTGPTGAGVYFEPTDAPALLEAARTIAQATRFTGQLALDAIEEAGTGVLYLIECNPRATMGLALLSGDPGFADEWRRILAGEPGGLTFPVTLPAAQVRLATLLYGAKYHDRDRSLARWLSDTLFTPDALAADEPRLWWGQFYTLARYANAAQRAGLSLTAYTTQDIEWNGPGDRDPGFGVRGPGGREPVHNRPLFSEETDPTPALKVSPNPESRTPIPALRRPALFTAFPELEEHLPWSPLLNAQPTPVERVPLPGLALDLWVKRDDKADARYGGNKARKFEWILGDALAQERRSLITFGGLCSNHCTAAAIYARAAGLDVRLYFTATPLTSEEVGLLYLQALLGAEQAMLSPVTVIDLVSEAGRANGSYLVPPGGSSGAGILGFVDAGLELAGQITRGECPRPDLIYIASASRGTVLGLALGLHLSGLSPLPRLVPVETVTPFWQRARAALAVSHCRTYDRLRHLLPDARALLPPFDSLVPDGIHRYENLALGQTNDEIQAAMANASVPLDTHFSGKAFAALLADARAGGLDGKTVLFWQTHGQVPELQLREARRLAAAGSLLLPPDVERASR